MTDSIPSRHTTLAGAVGLFGLFAGLCATFALVVTVFQWRAERAQTQWPLVSASIEHAEIAEYATSKGATTWSLRYRVRYDADWQERVATLSSRSTSAAGEVAALRAWLKRHGRGGRIDVRYDPAQPDHAVFASDMPSAGLRTPNNVTFTAIAAIACVVLIALGRFLAAREPSDAATRPLSPRAKVYVGAACAAMGLLVLATGTHSALNARHAPIADDFMFAPAALAFVFAGGLLALPPERKRLMQLFGALLLTSFAVTFDWIAFAPGERHFSGGISLGGLSIGARPGELLGRAMFGVGAVVFDIVAAVLWLRLLRALPLKHGCNTP